MIAASCAIRASFFLRLISFFLALISSSVRPVKSISSMSSGATGSNTGMSGMRTAGAAFAFFALGGGMTRALGFFLTRLRSSHSSATKSWSPSGTHAYPFGALSDMLGVSSTQSFSLKICISEPGGQSCLRPSPPFMVVGSEGCAKGGATGSGAAGAMSTSVMSCRG